MAEVHPRYAGRIDVKNLLRLRHGLADSGLDTGDICEQEIVKIDYNLRPREFYEQEIIPAMQRTLKRSLNDLQKGIKRRVPQIEKYATFDKRI